VALALARTPSRRQLIQPRRAATSTFAHASSSDWSTEACVSAEPHTRFPLYRTHFHRPASQPLTVAADIQKRRDVQHALEYVCYNHATLFRQEYG
jgi:hypothetical protein